MVHEQMARFYQGFRRDAHPMAVMVGVVGAMAAFYHDSTDITDPHQRMVASMPHDREDADDRGDGLQVQRRPAVRVPEERPRLHVELPAHVLRGALRGLQGQPDHLPRARPHLHPARRPRAERLDLDRASAGSSGANPFACIAAGIASLWGPAHGGANEAALAMLAEIGDVKNIPAFISRVKDKKDHTRLMGFGHRVYKNYDPRAKLMQKTCHQVLSSSASRTTRCSKWRWSWSASR
jgi:citrate synthase